MEEHKIIKDDEIDLLALFAVLWKERKKIIYITAAFTVIGIIYALLVTPWYEATVKIMPSSDSGSKLGQYAGIAAMVGINLSGGGEDKQAFYPDIIKSNFVLDRVLEHKFKTKSFDCPVTLFEFWETNIDSSEEDWQHELYEESKKTLRENYISASIDRKTQLHTLSVIVPKDPV
jgi:LPS O-antigen subunit length determinant protein (WzzB/FepE family)